MNLKSDIQKQLHDLLSSQCLISNDTVWYLQTGGRTNQVWRLVGEQDLICKLYSDASDNPLYANSPKAEFDCLEALIDTDCAPIPHKLVKSDFGTVLLYHFIDGHLWNEKGQEVAALLAKVHQVRPPEKLRVLSEKYEDVRSHGMSILDEVDTGLGFEIRKSCPIVKVDPIDPVLIHTDVVPGNLVNGSNGLRLIDWQCPAIGDPVVDISIFLSPAMHLIYRKSPLSDFEREAFLNALPSCLKQRYEDIGILYHWRTAAYCLWRAKKGELGYLEAAKAEMKLLKQSDDIDA